ncbi:hypothetical protein ACIRSU_34925 [Streptomyces sp. NPDC101160]|uniref:hypothetical protein n=1 Tax=Streptomyces sp. NPDC101160 TaxID=3366118 RepID=UPI0037F201B3
MNGSEFCFSAFLSAVVLDSGFLLSHGPRRRPTAPSRPVPVLREEVLPALV